MFFRSIALVRSETITVGLIVVSRSSSSTATVFHRALPARASVPANPARFAIKRGKRKNKSRDKRSEKRNGLVAVLWEGARDETRGGGRQRRRKDYSLKLLLFVALKLEVEYSRRAFRRCA